jgi:hypothetical protein
MNNYIVTFFLLFLSTFSFVSRVSKAEDDALIIRKGTPSSISPDYEVVSGENEIAGDPSPSLKESYALWKNACKEWKEETKKSNKDGQILSISCNTPAVVLYPNHQRAYRSVGNYKVRVKIRYPSGK